MDDVRGALRLMRRDPGFSAVAVLTLALGIGATTAILNVVNALVLRPLPFTDADRLVVLFATTPKQGVFRDTTSFWDFQAWKTQSHAFTTAAAYRQDRFNITGDGVPEPLAGLRASHELFDVLGVSPAIGRMFNEQEQQRNDAVALISHGLWTRRYASDPQIVGRTILLNEMRHVVIGVLPPGFQFLPFQDTDVLLPIPQRPCRSCGYLRSVARLKPRVPPSTAQLELDTIAAQLATAFPESNGGRGVNVVGLQDVAVGPVSTQLFVLLAAGVFVLLIGCGNVGNLLLARGLTRQRELAVRSALGAGTGRLVLQLLTESVALALVAAVLGAAIAHNASQLLTTSLSQRFPLPAISFNWTFLGFAFLIAVTSGLLCGVALSLMVWKSDLSAALKLDGRSQTGGAATHWLRDGLMVAQTALTVMLLIGAGLLARSFVKLQQVNIGLNPHHLLTADLLLPARYADPERRQGFLRDVRASIEALPGVERVALHTDSPFYGGGSRETFSIEGQPDPGPKTGHPARCNLIDGDFFGTVGVQIVRGRSFDGRDTASSLPVAVVNESMARQFWPDRDAIGQRLRLYYGADRQHWLTVVGVVRDAYYRYDESTRAPNLPTLRSQVFLPDLQRPLRTLPYGQSPIVSLAVRTATSPAHLTTSVQAAVWSVDKDQPVLNVQSMEQILWRSVAAPRITMLLVGVFAAFALVIACAGIYGLGAYAVVRRTREIGIRLAVGATPRQILALVLRHGMIASLSGAAIGIAGSLAMTRVISGFVFGITPTDIPTFVGVVLLFSAVAFASTYIPARRASRIDPSVAFRY
jgi:putative ABC transport system permease protein